MSALSNTIRLVAEKARKYTERQLGEQNTKASLIEPILEALGWDIRDPDEVHREFRPTGKDSPVDYALKLMRKPRLFVEAKGLGETLADRRWIAQVLGYAIVAGVEWCVLTDGDEYRFYNATAPIDAEEKMFWRVRLTESKEDDAERTLGLMSRSNLEKNLLDVLWVSHFVDRRVKVAIAELFAVPERTMVRAVRQRVPKLTAKEIAESIRRLDIHIELPSMLPAARAANTASQKQGRRSSQRRRWIKEGGQVSLIQIIEAGLVATPQRLYRRYKGTDLQATLLPNGEVSFQGASYETCSSAAEAARATVTGRRMSTNGWTFWQYEDAVGDVHQLDALRQQLASRESAKTTEQPALKLSGKAPEGRIA